MLPARRIDGAIAWCEDPLDRRYNHPFRRPADENGDRLTFSLDEEVNGQEPPADLAVVEQDGTYALRWDTTGYALGSYTVRARVSDAAGDVASALIALGHARPYRGERRLSWCATT